MNRQFQVREAKRPNRSFSRQVSLETGFTALNIIENPRLKMRQGLFQEVDVVLED